MTNKEFDHVIKKKFKNLQTDSKGDWQSFAKKLAENDVTAQKFDDQIQEKLKNHKLPENNNHWQLLRDRLRKEENVRTNLYLSKCAEVLCLLLFVWTINYLGFIKVDFDKNANPAMFAHLYKKSKVDFIPISLPKIQEKNTASSASVNKSWVKEYTPPIYNDLPLASDDAPLSTIQRLPVELVSKISQKPGGAEHDKLTILREQVSPLKEIDKIKNKTIKPLRSKKPKILPIYVYVPENYTLPQKTKYELGIYNGAGLNIIHSPYDPIYATDPNTRYGGNYKMGLTLAAGSERFKVNTGLEVERMSYKPLEVIEPYQTTVAGTRSTQLKKIYNTIAAVPIGLDYKVLQLGKNKDHEIHLNGAVNSNFILTSQFDINDFIDENINSLSAQNRKGGGRSAELPKLYSKEFNRGIFRSPFLDNFFLDANLEIGYHRPIVKNANLTFNLGYKYFLGQQGLGPNNDRYNQVYSKIGLNYVLN